MMTWRSHLNAVLARLARTQGKTRLRQIERTLCDIFDAEEVRFQNLQGGDIHGGMPIEEALSEPFLVRIRVKHDPADQIDEGLAATTGELASRFVRDGERGHGMRPVLSPQECRERFVREFDRLEHDHEFMWAGFIVKQMLPHMGMLVDEAKQFLDDLQADGMVQMVKVPNPKNPEYPATGVRLNHDHPLVKELLEAAEQPAQQNPGEPVENAGATTQDAD